MHMCVVSSSSCLLLHLHACRAGLPFLSLLNEERQQNANPYRGLQAATLHTAHHLKPSRLQAIVLLPCNTATNRAVQHDSFAILCVAHHTTSYHIIPHQTTFLVHNKFTTCTAPQHTAAHVTNMKVIQNMNMTASLQVYHDN